MKYEKYSFIGKIDKISEDFNTYFDQLDAMKNLEKDSGELLSPEFYLQSIINRKRPETAVPCSNRNNRNFEAQDQKIKKPNRIKTSTNKRGVTSTPIGIESEFDKSLIFQDINENYNQDNNNDGEMGGSSEKNNFFGINNFNNEENLFPGCYQQDENEENDCNDNDNEIVNENVNINENILNLNNNINVRTKVQQGRVSSRSKNKSNTYIMEGSNKKKEINLGQNNGEDVFSFRNTKQKIGKEIFLLFLF